MAPWSLSVAVSNSKRHVGAFLRAVAWTIELVARFFCQKVVEQLQGIERKHESEKKRRAVFVCGWRVFALQRKLTAKRIFATLRTSDARKRRRNGLLPPEIPGAAARVTYFQSQRRPVCAVFLPGGERIVNMDRFGNLWISSVEDGTQLWEAVDVHSGEGTGRARPRLAVLGDRIFVTGELTDGVLRTWNADIGEQLSTIMEAGDGVSALAAINGRQFVAGLRRGDIMLYDHEQGKKLGRSSRFVFASPRGELGIVYFPVDFAICGERLASVFRNGEVRIWDLQTRLLVAVISGQGTGEVTSVDISDSFVVIASYNAPHLRVYSIAENYAQTGVTGACEWVHDDEVNSVHILDSKLVMTTSEDQTIAIWELNSSKVIVRVRLDFGPSSSVVLPDGSIAVAVVPLISSYPFAAMILPSPPAATTQLKAHGESKRRARLS